MYYEKGKIRCYEGKFEEDRKHGEGVCTDENGSQILMKYWKDSILSQSLLKKGTTPQIITNTPLFQDNAFYKFT